MRTSKDLALLFLISTCLTIYLQPVGMAANNYIAIGPGVKFYESHSEGPILFASTIRTSGIYFSDGYTYFGNLRFSGGYAINSVGFKCGSNANMTISKIEYSELTYIVNAAQGQTSITKVFYNKKPLSISGATSWTYSNGLLTVNVKHSSPATVTVSYAEAVAPKMVEAQIILIAIMPLLVIYMVIADLQNGELGMGTVWKSVLLIALLGAVAYMIRGWGY